MGTSKDFAAFCCELLSSLGPCVAKRMFGGFGISTDGLTVAIIADLGGGERLYLKADETSRSRFEAEGGLRFVYEVKGKGMGLNYYTVPDEAMESPAEMQRWAALALEAAVKARKPAPRPKARAVPASKSAAKPVAKAAKPTTNRTKAAPAKAPAARKSAKG